METKDININDIEVLENIRVKSSDDDLADLMQNIKENGLMQSIGVKERSEGKYILIWGWRRLQAFKKLGYKTIRATIFRTKEEKLTESDFLIMNAGENIQRKNVNIIEFGRICEILHTQHKLSLSEIAVRMGVAKTRVENALVEFRRVPIKYRNKVVVFNNATATDKKGLLASGIVAKVVKLRNLSKVEKEKLIGYISKNDINNITVDLLNEFFKEGFSLKEAIKKSADYRVAGFKLIFKKDKLDKILEENKGGLKSLIKSTLNKTYKDLIL